MQGVASLASARRDRSAEQNALDRAYGQALYRQSLGEATSAKTAEDQAIRRDTLALNQKKELDNVIGNIQGFSEKRGLAILKTQGLIGLDTPPEEIATKLNAWVAQDLANNKAFKQAYKERYGSEYDMPTTGGGASYVGYKIVK